MMIKKNRVLLLSHFFLEKNGVLTEPNNLITLPQERLVH